MTELDTGELEDAKPTPDELLLKTPLYTSIQFDDWTSLAQFLMELRGFSGAVDTYCPWCKQGSTLRSSPTAAEQAMVNRAGSLADYSALLSVEQFVTRAYCTRIHDHWFFAYFIVIKLKDRHAIVKVGQYPSVADIQKPETKKFAKVLGDARRKELNRAIGLAANGVGVGSYIYLRRVFESLIQDAAAEAKALPGWDDAAYDRARMNEKIKLLSAHLPAFLVEHPQLYGILSRAVHELTEEECLTNYETVLLAITIILEHRLQKIEDKARENAARAAITKISGQTGKS